MRIAGARDIGKKRKLHASGVMAKGKGLCLTAMKLNAPLVKELEIGLPETVGNVMARGILELPQKGPLQKKSRNGETTAMDSDGIDRAMRSWDSAFENYVQVSTNYIVWPEQYLDKKLAAYDRLVLAGSDLYWQLSRLKEEILKEREADRLASVQIAVVKPEDAEGPDKLIPLAENTAAYLRDKVHIGDKLEGMGFEIEVTAISEDLNLIETRVIKATEDFNYPEGFCIRWLLNVCWDSSSSSEPTLIYEEESSRNGTYGRGSAQRLMYVTDGYVSFDIDS